MKRCPVKMHNFRSNLKNEVTHKIASFGLNKPDCSQIFKSCCDMPKKFPTRHNNFTRFELNYSIIRRVFVLISKLQCFSFFRSWIASEGLHCLWALLNCWKPSLHCSKEKRCYYLRMSAQIAVFNSSIRLLSFGNCRIEISKLIYHQSQQNTINLSRNLKIKHFHSCFELANKRA